MSVPDGPARDQTGSAAVSHLAALSVTGEIPGCRLHLGIGLKWRDEGCIIPPVCLAIGIARVGRSAFPIHLPDGGSGGGPLPGCFGHNASGFQFLEVKSSSEEAGTDCEETGSRSQKDTKA